MYGKKSITHSMLYRIRDIRNICFLIFVFLLITSCGTRRKGTTPYPTDTTPRVYCNSKKSC